MASKKKIEFAKLSPRETRLLSFMTPGRWASSADLMVEEFRGKKRPENARLLVTVAMYRAMSKIASVRGGMKIEKRGGGRRGTEYMIAK